MVILKKDKNKLEIWEKTDGHCHFCGKKLVFKNYGKNKLVVGNWYIDHIFPKSMGGKNETVNYLPICGECNRLKWHRTGKEIQELMKYGLVSIREKKKKSKIGIEIFEIYNLQKKKNEERRKNNLKKYEK